MKPCASQSVVDLRVKLKPMSSAYHEAPSLSRQVNLSMARTKLDDAYLDAEVDYISGKINNLSRYHISNRLHLAGKQ